MANNIDCCALVATRDRFDLLADRSLPSIYHQKIPPCLTLVINDGKPFSSEECQEIKRRLFPITALILQNENFPGAAGAWNHGLRYLLSIAFDGFVAFLDDDDCWDTDHLSENLEIAYKEKSNVVISGLRIIIDGQPGTRELITSLSYRDFLTGNPGWQGTNTFVHIDLLQRIQGFRHGLQSTNDRDLAIRILKHPDCRIGYTERWTSTWHLATKGDQLSSKGTASKLAGLRWFWHFYGGWMTEKEADFFFERTEKLFGFKKLQVIESGVDLPTHHRMIGDLDA